MRAGNGTRGLHPESTRRDFRHFVRPGSAPRVSRPRVETSTLPLLRVCGFMIPRASNPRRRASSPPSWSATSSPSPPQYTPSSSSTSRSCGRRLLAVIGSPGRGIRLHRRARRSSVASESSRSSNGGIWGFCTSGPSYFE
ncbi:hypothetical protein F2Q70_00034992 [Brassica cretica]|uniref:Uncharacterized protein n=1 Tax=Brassica cretica TaxID=69181 RepID=A0A8S9MEV1_BRACR|nr:hypothetical protein F2Q70_00034992 [Brassica cretica]KAF2618694.1 hypothetical protein F2Q68_00040928 [Brassica cretica]